MVKRTVEPEIIPNDYNAREGLQNVLGLFPKHHDFKMLGELLGRAVGRKSYSPSYVRNAYFGKVNAGGPFRLAVWRFSLAKPGENPYLISMVEVTIMAPVGWVQEGTRVFKRSRRCAGCGNHFIQNVWNHKYCTPLCRRR